MNIYEFVKNNPLLLNDMLGLHDLSGGNNWSCSSHVLETCFCSGFCRSTCVMGGSAKCSCVDNGKTMHTVVWPPVPKTTTSFSLRCCFQPPAPRQPDNFDDWFNKNVWVNREDSTSWSEASDCKCAKGPSGPKWP